MRWPLLDDTNCAGTSPQFEAIGIAGGFKTTSSLQNVTLIHRLSDGSDYGEVTRIDFRRLSKKKSPVDMPLMRPGDVLLVTTNKFTKLERIVRLSGIGLYYPLP